MVKTRIVETVSNASWLKAMAVLDAYRHQAGIVLALTESNRARQQKMNLKGGSHEKRIIYHPHPSEFR